MRGAGLSDTYPAYLDLVPALTLASWNAMSLFGFAPVREPLTRR